MRDDSPQKTKDILARRVAYRCSNPECEMVTIGPNSDPDNAINIGVAAHITAASVGGPRYDSLLTVEERSALENGIWVCQSCSKLIDSDKRKYTIQLLKQWKTKAEINAGKQLNKQMFKGSFFVESGDMEAIKENGFFEKQLGEQKIRYYLQGEFLHVEHEPAPGIIAYTVLNQNGDIVENKLPYDVDEYEFEIDSTLILNRVTENLTDDLVKETVYMKWGKLAVFIYQSGKLVQFHIEKGFTINHVLKKIWINPPEFNKN